MSSQVEHELSRIQDIQENFCEWCYIQLRQGNYEFQHSLGLVIKPFVKVNWMEEGENERICYSQTISYFCILNESMLRWILHAKSSIIWPYMHEILEKEPESIFNIHFYKTKKIIFHCHFSKGALIKSMDIIRQGAKWRTEWIKKSHHLLLLNFDPSFKV